MQIDINQLPIPDWGLKCPRCEYSLRGLPKHICPECGLTLNMAELVKPWTRLREPTYTGDELPIPDFGLRCGQCNAPAAGWPTHACPHCGHLATMRWIQPQEPWFQASAWASDLPGDSALEAVLIDEAIPHIRSISRSGADVLLARGVGAGVLFVSSEFYFDYLALMQTLRLADQEQSAPRPEWRCEFCGEMCPENFELCWSCGTPRDEPLQSGTG
ncbi:MAG: hypothetical protein JNG88_13085 [Phycisphaerales bacterium]|nr:hypothetical protein [Phycisphaerales bacterium]